MNRPSRSTHVPQLRKVSTYVIHVEDRTDDDDRIGEMLGVAKHIMNLPSTPTTHTLRLGCPDDRMVPGESVYRRHIVDDVRERPMCEI